MAEEKEHTAGRDNSIQEFTVQFVNAQVHIDNTALPLGDVSTEILNLTEEQLRALHEAAEGFSDFIARNFMPAGKDNLATFAQQLQEKANKLQGVMYTLPPYRHMDYDGEMAKTAFASWHGSDPEDFALIFRKGSIQNISLSNFISSMISAFWEITEFRAKVTAMLEVYLERLPKRNPAEYARGALEFIRAGEMLDGRDELLKDRSVFKIQQTRTVMIEFIPMEDEKQPGGYAIAERMVFHSISEFLHMDIFRALMHGNAPRRCHNCGRYFLLTAGYNTCYCNNVAPGETERTCRKVGAHRKEAVKKGMSPIRVEYDRVYRRLTTRKNRGKLSADEWNQLIALAQDYKDRADRGELSELELKGIYDEF